MAPAPEPGAHGPPQPLGCQGPGSCLALVSSTTYTPLLGLLLQDPFVCPTSTGAVPCPLPHNLRAHPPYNMAF